MWLFISLTATMNVKENLNTARCGNNLICESGSKVGMMERQIRESDLDANSWQGHGSIASKPGYTRYC